MASQANSSKRIKIDKANTTMVIAISVASFLLVFSLVASKSLLSQRAYQARVIVKKEKARNQLKSNVAAADNLVNSYKAFVSTPANIIGGIPTGTGDRDGDNAKIILDALPSSYDFPALATSVEGILSQKSLKIQSINGSDEQLTQQAAPVTTIPSAVPMPFTASVQGNYQSLNALVVLTEQSIRPIQIQSISLNGSDSDLNMSITAQTFYQPPVSLKNGTVVVK